MNAKRTKAEITVFLALSFVLVASLVLACVESVRMQATSTYLTVAANSAIDSLYSQYHLALWEEYRLLGAEMYSNQEVTEEYYEFLKPYLSDLLTHNWYVLSADQEDITLEQYSLITDENGKEFEEAVRNYMIQGGIISAALGEQQLQDSIDLFQNAESMQQLSEEFSVSSKKALKLEKCFSSIETSVNNANKNRSKAISALKSGKGSQFSRQAGQMEKELKNIQTQAETANSLAAEIRDESGEKKQLLDEKYTSGTITEESYKLMCQELEEIDSYTDESGQQMRKVRDVTEAAERNLSVLSEAGQLAYEAEEYISNWVPDEILVGYDPPTEEGGERIPRYRTEKLNTKEVWADTLECFEETEALDFSSGSGEVNQKKKRGYEALEKVLSGSFLQLVYPEADALSKEAMDLEGSPSGKYLTEKTSVLSGDSLVNRFLVGEYAMMKLSNLNPGGEQAQKPELEYVLFGKESDYENVSAMVARVVALRSGQNLITILSDQKMRSQAISIASLILGATPAAGFIKALGFVLMALWGTAQAIVDARRIFTGQSIPLQHTAKSFDLSLDGLLDGSVTQLLTETAKSGQKKNTSGGEIDYETYLKMFLLLSSGSETDYRIMDIIQVNLRENQSDFLMERLHTSDTICVKAESKHLFTSIFGDLSGKYELSATSSYSY